MTKDEALKLALEALIYASSYCDTYDAITAIKQALANEALDKKAENARELGLDYEPNYKVTVVDDQHPKGVPLEQWGRPAPVQEPVAWMDEFGNVFPLGAQRGPKYLNEPMKPLYTTPPAAQRPDVDALVALARADEREACAKVCDALQDCGPENGCCPTYWNEALEKAEAAIRARGNT
jgi:hypothetical protein